MGLSFGCSTGVGGGAGFLILPPKVSKPALRAFSMPLLSSLSSVLKGAAIARLMQSIIVMVTVIILYILVELGRVKYS